MKWINQLPSFDSDNFELVEQILIKKFPNLMFMHEALMEKSFRVKAVMNDINEGVIWKTHKQEEYVSE